MAAEYELPELVEKAKEAVSGLDEPYRMEAFKIVLDRLMSGAPNTLNAGITSANKPTKKGKSKPQSIPSTSADSPMAALNLSTDDLDHLRKFYAAYSPSGGEMVAFILAAFISQELGVEEFNEVHVVQLYRALISIKAKVPVIKEWKRSLRWLCAPSRRKEWLEKSGSGFKLTNAGLIALNDMEKKEV